MGGRLYSRRPPRAAVAFREAASACQGGVRSKRAIGLAKPLVIGEVGGEFRQQAGAVQRLGAVRKADNEQRSACRCFWSVSPRSWRASRWALVTAIAALGMKTSFKDLAKVGWKPIALMVLETAWIAALTIVAVKLS
jgi:hypothetical protein